MIRTSSGFPVYQQRKQPTLMEAIQQRWNNFTFWLEALFIFVYEILCEWFKLTATILIILAIPLFAYILWDMFSTDLSLASHLLTALSSWVHAHQGFCAFVLMGILYITYLNVLDLRSRKGHFTQGTTSNVPLVPMNYQIVEPAHASNDLYNRYVSWRGGSSSSQLSDI